jgi:hypothetical protein
MTHAEPGVAFGRKMVNQTENRSPNAAPLQARLVMEAGHCDPSEPNAPLHRRGKAFGRKSLQKVTCQMLSPYNVISASSLLTFIIRRFFVYAIIAADGSV